MLTGVIKASITAAVAVVCIASDTSAVFREKHS